MTTAKINMLYKEYQNLEINSLEYLYFSLTVSCQTNVSDYVFIRQILIQNLLCLI